MIRAGCLAIVAAFALTTAAQAQTAAWRFQFQPGQVLTYRVEQETSAAEVIDGKKSETGQKLTNVKRWQVTAVDAAGVATLQLALTALRIETKTPSGETLLFDSANPQGSDPQMRDQLTKYVGHALAIIRVNPQGKVLEVKESKFGPASRFESEPPFVATLSEQAPQRTWERAYKITVEPPFGTGEKYDAAQQYSVQSFANGVATIGITTTVKTLPKALADQIPLLQMQPQSEVVFDVQHGRLLKARMKIEKALSGHQGEGSSYRFVSSTNEELIKN